MTVEDALELGKDIFKGLGRLISLPRENTNLSVEVGDDGFMGSLVIRRPTVRSGQTRD